ncbi:MAG: OmpA family protein [Gammaproteobacteria bacterium]|nr:OmpA family protein [Gammaproteobacteria bacterium]
MRLSLTGALLLLLAGCAGEVAMPGPFTQPNALADADGDGVIDARERCQQTPSGAKVDNYGCSDTRTAELVVEMLINFANDSAQIPAADIESVAALAVYLRRQPTARARLDGHASAIGPDGRNNQLALRRAQAVRDQLVKQHGIAPERIEISGHGSGQPLLAGDDERSHSANRRVEGVADGLAHTADVMRWTIYTPGR